MSRDLLALSWSELSGREQGVVIGFFVKRAIALGCLVVGTTCAHLDLVVLGAALYLDARLALR